MGNVCYEFGLHAVAVCALFNFRTHAVRNAVHIFAEAFEIAEQTAGIGLVFEVALGNGFARFLQFAQVDGGINHKRNKNEFFRDPNDYQILGVIYKSEHKSKFRNGQSKRADSGFGHERNGREKTSHGAEKPSEKSDNTIYYGVFDKSFFFYTNGKTHCESENGAEG